MNAEERLRYVGVLGLLCEASVYVPEDVRESMENALEDACQDGTLEWTRTLDRLDLHVVSRSNNQRNCTTKVEE